MPEDCERALTRYGLTGEGSPLLATPAQTSPVPERHAERSVNGRHGWLAMQNRSSLHQSRHLNVRDLDGSRPAHPQPTAVSFGEVFLLPGT